MGLCSPSVGWRIVVISVAGVLGAVALAIALPSGAQAAGHRRSIHWNITREVPASASSTTSTTLATPSVSFVGPASQTIDFSGVRGGNGLFIGHVNLLIQNGGTAITTAKLSVYGDSTMAGGPTVLMGASHPFTIGPFGVTPKLVAITTTNPGDNNLTVVLTVIDPSGVAPTTEVFKVERLISLTYLWLPILLGAGFALVFLATRYVAWKIRSLDLRKAIYPPPSWTFGGSWVTVVSVLGAVLTTILGASGLIADLFPNTDVQRFGVLNLVFGGIVLLGAMVYAALSKVGQVGDVDRPLGIYGTPQALLFASTVTLFGVAGQLITLGELASLSESRPPNVWAIIVAIVIVLALLFWYGMQSVNQLATNPAPPQPSAPSLPGLLYSGPGTAPGDAPESPPQSRAFLTGI